jgi:hypothetical protein
MGRVGARPWTLATVATIVMVTMTALAATAAAGSDWDPDDVRGLLDIRWVGAAFRADDTIRLTVSMYGDFRVSALPETSGKPLSWFGQRGLLRVRLTAHLSGFFVQRRSGRVVFLYGDTGSSCCSRARVRRPSATVLRVVFPVIHDAADLTYEVQARSEWKKGGDLYRDRTGTIELGAPPG